MRSSSRRLKVTSLAGACVLSSPPRHALGSVSPISMRRLLCHVPFMIAPDGCVGKGLRRGKCTARVGGRGNDFRGNLRPRLFWCDICGDRNHAFVKSIIIRPYFGQAQAKLTCETLDRCLKARSGSLSGFLSPPAPRGADGPGQSSAYGSIPKPSRPAAAGLYLLWVIFAELGRRGDARHLSLMDCRVASDDCWPSGVYAAPRMKPGLSCVPSWIMTAAASISSVLISEIGTAQVASVPVQSPSLSQRRTTL